MITITKKELYALMGKIHDSINGICVSVVNDKVLANRADSDLTRKIMRSKMDRVVGFYNSFCTTEMLIEDLDYFGVGVDNES